MTKHQRYSDTSYDNVNATKIRNEEKQRSESLPGSTNERPYTGAISKLKTFEPRDVLSSQDSGINLSFHEDERKRTRNSIEK